MPNKKMNHRLRPASWRYAKRPRFAPRRVANQTHAERAEAIKLEEYAVRVADFEDYQKRDADLEVYERERAKKTGATYSPIIPRKPRRQALLQLFFDVNAVHTQGGFCYEEMYGVVRLPNEKITEIIEREDLLADTYGFNHSAHWINSQPWR